MKKKSWWTNKKNLIKLTSATMLCAFATTQAVTFSSLNKQIISANQQETTTPDPSVPDTTTPDTTIESGDLGLTNIYASAATNAQVIDAIIQKQFIKNHNPNVPPTATHITMQDKDYNDITGTLMCSLVLSNSIAQEGGNPVPNKTFTNLSFTGFKQRVPTSFTAVTNITEPNEFRNKAADQVTTQQMTNYVFRNKNKFIVNEAPNTTENNILLVDPTPNKNAGTYTFKVKINKYYDENNGKVITTTFDQSNKISNVYTVSGFRVQEPTDTNTLVNSGFNVTMPDGTPKWKNTAANLQTAKTEILKALKATTALHIPPDADITVSYKSETPDKTPNGEVKFDVVLNKKYNEFGDLVTENTRFVVSTTKWQKYNTEFLLSNNDKLVYSLNGSQEHTLDDTSNDAIKEFVLREVKAQKVITGDFKGKEIPNLELADFTITLGTRNYTNNTIDITILFKANTIYNNGALITNEKTLNLKVEFKKAKVTDVKNGGQFTYNQLTTSTPIPPLDDPQITRDTETYFRSLLFNARRNVFSNLPSSDIVLNDIQFVAYPDGKKFKIDLHKGQVIFTAKLSKSLPENNKQFEITVKGFAQKITALRTPGLTTFPFGDFDSSPTVADQAWIKTNIIDSNKYRDTIFINIPENYNTSNITIANISYTAEAVLFDITLNNVYTDSGTLGPIKLTINGFKDTDATTKVRNGSIAGADGPYNKFASEVDVNDNALKQKIIDNKLIVGTYRNQTLVPADIVLSNITQKNDLDGTLALDLTINNSKAQENNQVVASKKFTSLKLSGFKTRQYSKFAIVKEVSDKASFGSKYANQMTDAEVQQYIFDHQSVFFDNVPTLTKDNIIVSNTRQTSVGEAGFKLGLQKFYDQNDGTEKFEQTPKSFVTEEFRLTGFDTRNTTLSSPDGIYNYHQLWDSTTQAPTLDDPKVTKEYFREAIHRNASTIFVQGPDTVNLDNVIVHTLNTTIWNGTATVEFELNNAKPQSKRFTMKVNGFVDKLTTITASNFSFGDPNKPAISVDKTWVKNKVIEMSGTIFSNLPSFNTTDELNTFLNNNITIGAIDFNEAEQGLISFPLTINNVYVDGNTITRTLTFSGFRTKGLTTLIDLSVTRLNGVTNIYASSITNDSMELKNAIIRNNLFLNFDKGYSLTADDIRIDNIKNPNDLNGHLTIELSIINNKGWKKGVHQQEMSFPEITLNGFNQRLATEIRSGTIVDKAAFGNMWVDQFDNTKLAKYVIQHKEKFFTNEPENITEEDIYISQWKPQPLAGNIDVNIGLKKYYNDTDGLLTNGDGSNNAEAFILSGFIVNQIGNTSITEDVVQNGIKAGDILFNNIFYGDKGFIIDWFRSANYELKEKQIKDYFNNSMKETQSNNPVVINPSLNGYNTVVKNVELDRLDSYTPSKNNLQVTITFDDWIVDGLSTNDHKETLNIWLRESPDSRVFEDSIKEVLTLTLPSIINLPINEKEEKIRQIIAQQLNQQLDVIPDALIPTNDGNKIFKAKDLASTVIVFNNDNSCTVKRILLGDPNEGGIVIKQITVIPANLASSNWIMYALIGGLGTILGLSLITLMYIMSKYSKKRRDDVSFEVW